MQLGSRECRRRAALVSPRTLAQRRHAAQRPTATVGETTRALALGHADGRSGTPTRSATAPTIGARSVACRPRRPRPDGRAAELPQATGARPRRSSSRSCAASAAPGWEARPSTRCPRTSRSRPSSAPPARPTRSRRRCGESTPRRASRSCRPTRSAAPCAGSRVSAAGFDVLTDHARPLTLGPASRTTGASHVRSWGSTWPVHIGAATRPSVDERGLERRTVAAELDVVTGRRSSRRPTRCRAGDGSGCAA